MEIEQSSLYREISAIINTPSKPVHYAWRAEIHAGGETYAALKILNIDFDCDYENNYADVIMISLVFAGGTYAKRVYPYRTDLEITLYRTPLTESSDITNDREAGESERYTATLVDSGNPILESNGRNAPTENTLNLTSLFEVQFQLVNKSLEQLRMITVGGIYRATTVEEVVKGVLTRESARVVAEGVRMPEGVDMVEASNKAKREHIIIPQGTPLVSVPQYVHQKCGGIYNAGLGYYLQGNHWYVYPCFDTTRFNRSTRTLTIINVPKNKFPNVERTYRLDGTNLVVLATGEVSFRDDSDVQQLNLGNGVRFADASKFMEGFSTTVGNKTTVSRGANNSEFKSTERKNGNNNVRNSENPINANPFSEYSKMARRSGSFVTMVWENSQPSLIYPGMMVKIMYLDEDSIEEVEGVMLKAQHFVQTRGDGLLSQRHVVNSALAIFVQRKT